MDIAVLADIHGNYEAFQTCVHEARKRGIHRYIFLGDYLGDMAYPQKTLGLLRALQRECDCVFIRGNKENYWIDHRANPSENWAYRRSGTGMLRYNDDHLTQADINFFARMPISTVLHLDGFPDLTACHGSPFQVNQSMRPDYDYIDELSSKLSTEWTLCGHFHIQADYSRNGKRILNPGAVGVPLHSQGKTQFLILHGQSGVWEAEFLSLPYDREKTIRDMLEEGLDIKAPGWFRITKHLLETGETSHAAALKSVAMLYQEETGILTYQNIPEKYWEMATSEWA